jgi:hypothetical protein
VTTEAPTRVLDHVCLNVLKHALGDDVQIRDFHPLYRADRDGISLIIVIGIAEHPEAGSPSNEVHIKPDCSFEFVGESTSQVQTVAREILSIALRAAIVDTTPVDPLSLIMSLMGLGGMLGESPFGDVSQN